MTPLFKENRSRSCQSRICSLAAVALAATSLTTTAALADGAKDKASIWERETLTGDWGGARTALKNKGVDVTINYIAETLSNLSGGVRRGTTYEGRLEFSVDSDLEKLIGWKGGSSHVTAFQIHDVNNRNAADNVGGIADPSNIDALPTTRLYTAWFQQNAFDDRVSLRFGQLAADDEFLTSTTAGGLINGTFGWAAIMSANLPSGGPAYPLATPGIRLQLKPTENLSFLTGVFSGDPAGKNCTDDNTQACNRYGTKFSTSGGALWMSELQYAVNQEKDSKGLASAYKLGAWYHSGDRFADQRYGLDDTGGVVSRASSTMTDSLYRRGNWGVYGVIDQMIWRDGERNVAFFTRGGVVPSDRNLVSYYIDGGVGFKGLVPGRTDDTLTFGVAYAKVSKDAAALDEDTLALNGPPYPIRNAETVLELSYMAQIAPWWTIQPDIQYIIRPGGNVQDADNTANTVGNAFLVGVRSTLKF